MGINQGQISLDQKYTQGSGHVFMTGIQALVRLPMAQIRRDRAAGLNTAGFISGYRGSPLGGYDQQLFSARKHLEQYNIKFQPGVNEDLAATAIWGSQQLNLSPGSNYDGVVGIWYGKGPGVDRCGDVFRHGNAAGSAHNGGVLCLAGDDHGAKSSTVPHQSDHAFISALMPYLYPSSIHEMIEMGLLGIAMSRYSGCWVGMKVITEVVETTAEIDLTDEMKPFIIPTDFEMPRGGLNLRWPDDRYEQDLRLQDYKGFAAIAFARANRVNRITMDSPNARFGIMASGKSYEDVRQALRELVLQAVELCPIEWDDDAAMRLAQVAVDLIAAAPALALQLPFPSDPRAARLAARLQEDPSCEWELAELSREAGASARTVQRLFLAETGLRFAEWRQRLQDRFLMLAGTQKYRVESIAGMHGQDDWRDLDGFRTRSGDEKHDWLRHGGTSWLVMPERGRQEACEQATGAQAWRFIAKRR